MKSLTLTAAALVASTVVAFAAPESTSADKTDTVIIAEETTTGTPSEDTAEGTTEDTADSKKNTDEKPAQ